MSGGATYARQRKAASAPYRGIELRATEVARGLGAIRFHCRSVAQWRLALEALDFAVLAEPMSRGTPFANVLLQARIAKRP